MIAGVEPVWHLMVVRSERRDALQEALTRAQIGHLVHYPRACHLQGAYAYRTWPDLPVAQRLQHEVLSLPMAPYLSVDEVAEVAAVVRRTLA